MPLNSNKSTVTVVGDGVTTSFEFDFWSWSTDEMEVWYRDASGTSTLQTDNYTITLNDSVKGGTVEFPLVGDPVLATEEVIIRRSMPFTSTLDVESGRTFNPEIIELAIDRATAERQQLSEELSRAAVASPGQPNVEYLDNVLAYVNQAESYATSAATYASESGQIYTQTAIALSSTETARDTVLSVAGSLVTDTFADGVDYTAGTTTTLTLSTAPLGQDGVLVTFDGILQGPLVWYTTSNVLTFTEAIPLGTEEVVAYVLPPAAIGVPNDYTVSAAKIINGAVTTAKLQDGAVTEVKLGYNAVSTLNIKDGAVTTAKLISDAVSTEKVLDGAITAAKLATDVLSLLIPTGMIFPFAGDTIPDNFLWCDGGLSDRVTEAALFAAIGTKYGAGDGVTTFNRPDCRGEFLRGGDTLDAVGGKVGYSTARPNTPFTTNTDTHSHSGVYGYDYYGNYDTGGSKTGVDDMISKSTNADSHSHSITGGGDAETAPQHMLVNYMIKK